MCIGMYAATAQTVATTKPGESFAWASCKYRLGPIHDAHANCVMTPQLIGNFYTNNRFHRSSELNFSNCITPQFNIIADQSFAPKSGPELKGAVDKCLQVSDCVTGKHNTAKWHRVVHQMACVTSYRNAQHAEHSSYFFYHTEYTITNFYFPVYVQGDFTFVLIPANKKDPLQEVTKSKAGGLNDDELQKYAKEYFASSLDSQLGAEVLVLIKARVAFLLGLNVTFFLFKYCELG